jgi:hypothetical protein
MEIRDEKEHFPLRGITNDGITDTAKKPDFSIQGAKDLEQC